MRLDVSPRRADITPGVGLPITITIANTGTVIGGYTVRVLGADPSWVELETDQISLFPDETRTLSATVTAPVGIPAGLRRIAVQVRELTPPYDSSVTEIDLTVPSAESLQVRLDPMAVTAGKSASFSVIVENTGNTIIERTLAGGDEEGKVEFSFAPEEVSLAPGEHAVVDMRAKARRHFAGSPTVRTLQVYLDAPAPERFFDADPDRPTPRSDEQPPAANGTFIQRAFLSRGALSLVGLLAAITVFAIVITVAMSRLVSQTAADRDLALQIAAARNSGASSGTAGVSGVVTLLTTGKGQANVSVSVYAASDTSKPIATTATDSKGAYGISGLGAGKYKISYRGASFIQIWYPGTATDANATTITLAAGERHAGLDVAVGGVPATISGTIVGDDVATATLYLETVPTDSGGTGTAGGGRPLSADPNAPPPPPQNGNAAVVQTVPIGSDGTFTLTNVPSPSVYDLVVVKTGYATSTQRINVGAGADRSGVEIMLSKGDGLISGTVSSASGPLGGVTITATAGQSTSTTQSLNSGAVGTFTLRTLPTPGSFTVIASKGGYASQTLTLTLAAGQKLSGVAITLGQSSGSLTGTVRVAGDASPAGVAVTVTNGNLTVQTTTQSGAHPGTWTAAGLPIPGSYTVTFTRTDLASQTVSVALDAGGNVTAGSQSTTVTASGITITMQSATATVYGTVTQHGGASTCDSSDHLGEATVTLASSTTTYTVISASKPSSECGQYRLEQIPPGTYTLTVSAGSGTTPTSEVFTLAAGEAISRPVTLLQPASIAGSVTGTTGTPRVGWTVFLYSQSGYPGAVLMRTTTGSGGTFDFKGVAADQYIIAVGPTSNPSNAVVTQQVTVSPSQQRTGVDIEADP